MLKVENSIIKFVFVEKINIVEIKLIISFDNFII